MKAEKVNIKDYNDYREKWSDAINAKFLSDFPLHIDIELTSIIVNACNSAKVRSVNIAYKRRDIKDGKKLKVSDGWIILKRGFMSFIA